MRHAHRLTLSIALLAAGIPALADSSGSQSTATPTIAREEGVPEQGYRFHASLGGGFGTLAGGVYQSSPSGSYYLGSLGLGRRTRRWEWDTNVGWGYSNRSGLDSSGNPLEIRIRSARADFSGRYRLLSFLQVGPILTANFGTDTGFDTQISGSAATFYGGAKAVMDIGRAAQFPVQAWGEMLTELSSFGRDAFTILAGVRLSLPIPERRDEIRLTQAAPRQDIRVVLDARKVFFRFDSAKLRPEISNALRDVSKHLSENPAEWEGVVIAGHTDKWGSELYNQQLSERRARSVEKHLASFGLEPARVAVEAWGFSKPVDPSNHYEAWRRNRRVEITFKNVANPERLSQLLKPLESEARN